MAEPIEIVIRKTQETSTQPSEAGENAKKGKESSKAKAINAAIIQAGRQVANYGLSQYGNLTGNTIRQRQLENAIKIGSYVGQILIGGAVGAIAVGVQIGIEGIGNYVATTRANQQAELLYQRSGNVTLNGGRGTYD